MLTLSLFVLIGLTVALIAVFVFRPQITQTPAGKIAKALKRTEGATRQKAFSLGLSLDSRA
jgi:hypothetical protein